MKDRIKQLGIQWPEQPPQAMANYLTVRRSGNLLYTSGSGSFLNGKPLHVGKVGKEITMEEAYEAAKITAINLLCMLENEVGSLDKIRVIKLLGFVNSADDFFDQPGVINGASDILVEILGEKGKHARSAIGTSILPFNIPVEIEMIAEIVE
ncbi:RidA family protein [Bacillus sp. OxB-1]|uniref:RidA family protein n=1 Tax=Bacillus sp. (strain OxB-1) TaxID=98228 RepID=UPI0006979E5B|nr:RidA family protein [Bacillus sp. OxB-1]